MSVSFDDLEFESYPQVNGVTWVTEIFGGLSATALITLMEEIFIKLKVDPQKVTVSGHTDRYTEEPYITLQWDENAKDS